MMWSLGRYREFGKAYELLNKFMLYWSGVGKAYLYLLHHQYHEANNVVAEAFRFVAKERNVFKGGDHEEIIRVLNQAQLLVELEEAATFKLSSGLVDDVTNVWEHRVKGFTRDPTMWVQLLYIRSMLVPVSGDLMPYKKIISSMRKSRQFSLIDFFFREPFSWLMLPDIGLQRAKIFWAEGERDGALEMLEALTETFKPQIDRDKIYESYVHCLPGAADVFMHCCSSSDYFTARAEEFCCAMLDKGSFDRFLISFDQRTAEDQAAIVSALFRQFPNEMLDAYEDTVSRAPADERLKARVFRTLGTYIYRQRQPNFETFTQSAAAFKRAAELNPEEARSWRGWAYANIQLMNISKGEGKDDERRRYAIRAIKGFLRATQQSPSDTLEFLCQLFSILFKMKECDDEVAGDVFGEILKLESRVIKKVIPQINSHLGHSDPRRRKLVADILYQYGRNHYPDLVYALNLTSKIENDAMKVEMAHELTDRLTPLFPEFSEQAGIFIDGMTRVAITWFESWLHTLELASRTAKVSGRAAANGLFKRLFEEFEHPVCELDKLFVQLYGDFIRECRGLFENGSESAVAQLWANMTRFYPILEERVKKLEVIIVGKVSEELVGMEDTLIPIPGKYSVDRGDYPRIKAIEPVMEVLGTQQHPRCVYFQASDGSRFKFLLKGNEDLRLDQRLMQFFTLMNVIFRHNRTLRENKLFITRYSVIPISPSVGLIGWVTGADTMHQMIVEYRNLKGVTTLPEYEIINDRTEVDFSFLNNLQRFEIFKEVSKTCKAEEMRQLMWVKAPIASIWYRRLKCFTETSGLMSMVGYVIGLGDRHPSNIMVQRDTGRVIHIDFGESFESTIVRPLFPEKVPFRLTRMIVNAFDCSMVEGQFRQVCEDVMAVLRDNVTSLCAQLEIFSHEPIEEGTEDGRATNHHTRIIERVTAKLEGRDSDDGSVISVPLQVANLISVAIDPANYVTHYPGWCAFW